MITESEAIELIKMLKELLVKHVSIPLRGHETKLFAESVTTKNGFTIHINRKKRRSNRITFQARTDGNIDLMRLDVNPAPHKNKGESTITSHHLHIFKEGQNLSHAIPFDTSDNNLVQNCIDFFREFNIIRDEISITEQANLFS